MTEPQPSCGIQVFARLRPAKPRLEEETAAAAASAPSGAGAPSHLATPLRPSSRANTLPPPGTPRTGSRGGGITAGGAPATPGGGKRGLLSPTPSAGAPTGKHAFVGLRVLPAPASAATAPRAAAAGRPSVIVFEEAGAAAASNEAAAAAAARFELDAVYTPEVSQRAVWEEIGSQHVDAVLDGFNSTVFAYGRTGSGKTHTIIGPIGARHGGEWSFADLQAEDAAPDALKRRQSLLGLVPRVVQGLLARIRTRASERHFTLRFACAEIYNKSLFDLCAPAATPDGAAARFERAEVRESRTSGANAMDKLAWHAIDARPGLEEAAMLTAHTLITAANAARVSAATAGNTDSSRSHVLYLWKVTSLGVDGASRESLLSIVDLAGSEALDAAPTVVGGLGGLGSPLAPGASGAATLPLQSAAAARDAETRAINVSLHTLTRVVAAYASVPPGQRPAHVPYRESLLTMMLRDAIGGNCRTSIIVTLSADDDQLLHSFKSCQFAKLARGVRNVARENKTFDPSQLLASLQAQLGELRTAVADRDKEIAALERLAMAGGSGSSSSDGGEGICAPGDVRLSDLLALCEDPAFLGAATKSLFTGLDGSEGDGSGAYAGDGIFEPDEEGAITSPGGTVLLPRRKAADRALLGTGPLAEALDKWLHDILSAPCPSMRGADAAQARAAKRARARGEGGEGGASRAARRRRRVTDAHRTIDAGAGTDGGHALGEEEEDATYGHDDNNDDAASGGGCLSDGNDDNNAEEEDSFSIDDPALRGRASDAMDRDVALRYRLKQVAAVAHTLTRLVRGLGVPTVLSSPDRADAAVQGPASSPSRAPVEASTGMSPGVASGSAGRSGCTACALMGALGVAPAGAHACAAAVAADAGPLASPVPALGLRTPAPKTRAGSNGAGSGSRSPGSGSREGSAAAIGAARLSSSSSWVVAPAAAEECARALADRVAGWCTEVRGIAVPYLKRLTSVLRGDLADRKAITPGTPGAYTALVDSLLGVAIPTSGRLGLAGGLTATLPAATSNATALLVQEELRKLVGPLRNAEAPPPHGVDPRATLLDALANRLQSLENEVAVSERRAGKLRAWTSTPHLPAGGTHAGPSGSSTMSTASSAATLSFRSMTSSRTLGAGGAGPSSSMVMSPVASVGQAVRSLLSPLFGGGGAVNAAPAAAGTLGSASSWGSTMSLGTLGSAASDDAGSTASGASAASSASSVFGSIVAAALTGPAKILPVPVSACVDWQYWSPCPCSSPMQSLSPAAAVQERDALAAIEEESGSGSGAVDSSYGDLASLLIGHSVDGAAAPSRPAGCGRAKCPGLWKTLSTPVSMALSHALGASEPSVVVVKPNGDLLVEPVHKALAHAVRAATGYATTRRAALLGPGAPADATTPAGLVSGSHFAPDAASAPLASCATGVDGLPSFVHSLLDPRTGTQICVATGATRSLRRMVHSLIEGDLQKRTRVGGKWVPRTFIVTPAGLYQVHDTERRWFNVQGALARMPPSISLDILKFTAVQASIKKCKARFDAGLGVTAEVVTAAPSWVANVLTGGMAGYAAAAAAAAAAGSVSGNGANNGNSGNAALLDGGREASNASSALAYLAAAPLSLTDVALAARTYASQAAEAQQADPNGSKGSASFDWDALTGSMGDGFSGPVGNSAAAASASSGGNGCPAFLTALGREVAVTTRASDGSRSTISLLASSPHEAVTWARLIREAAAGAFSCSVAADGSDSPGTVTPPVFALNAGPTLAALATPEVDAPLVAGLVDAAVHTRQTAATNALARLDIALEPSALQALSAGVFETQFATPTAAELAALYGGVLQLRDWSPSAGASPSGVSALVTVPPGAGAGCEYTSEVVPVVEAVGHGDGVQTLARMLGYTMYSVSALHAARIQNTFLARRFKAAVDAARSLGMPEGSKAGGGASLPRLVDQPAVLVGTGYWVPSCGADLQRMLACGVLTREQVHAITAHPDQAAEAFACRVGQARSGLGTAALTAAASTLCVIAMRVAYTVPGLSVGDLCAALQIDAPVEPAATTTTAAASTNVPPPRLPSASSLVGPATPSVTRVRTSLTELLRTPTASGRPSLEAPPPPAPSTTMLDVSSAAQLSEFSLREVLKRTGHEAIVACYPAYAVWLSVKSVKEEMTQQAQQAEEAPATSSSRNRTGSNGLLSLVGSPVPSTAPVAAAARR